MNQFFILEAADGRGEILRGTAEGGKAIYVFKSRESAAAYVAANPKGTEWNIVELSPLEMQQRIETGIKNGLTDVIADIAPNTNESSVRLLPARSFLLILDLAAQDNPAKDPRS